MLQHSFFSTEVKEIQFSYQEIDPLVSEVLEKKQDIQNKAKIYSSNLGYGSYVTDFPNPIKLHEYEKLNIKIGHMFWNDGYFYDIDKYWTAIYDKNSLHDAHDHLNNIDAVQDNNFSTVLYLTSNGATNFFSSNSTSLSKKETIKSKVGKMIFFPSGLLHSANHQDDGERIIISSNVKIYKHA